jgi:hypothetical protein
MTYRAALSLLVACHSSPSSDSSPAASALMLPAPVHPGAIVERRAPPPSTEVVACFQQTRASQATGTDCRVTIVAGPQGVLARDIHQAARVYLGGNDYIALYVQPEAPNVFSRGAKLAEDATNLSSHVARNDAGRHFLFIELARK